VTSGTGKQIRLSRLFSNRDGRTVVFAFDHGMQVGPVPGAVDLRAGVSLAVEAGFDGIILAPGALCQTVELLRGPNRPAVVMRLDQTTMWRLGGQFTQEEGHTRQIADVEDAVRLGADAVLTFLFTCHRDPELETRSVEIVGRTAKSARNWGMPLVVEAMAARQGRLKTPLDAETIAMNTRIAVEIGADVIKTDWSGTIEGFRHVVQVAAGAPVLIAGGPRLDSDRVTLGLVRDLLAAGARGVMFGRSLFQSPEPLVLMKAVRDMVHDDVSFEDAVARLSPAPARTSKAQLSRAGPKSRLK
jgi:DhnA family fructose-bisphosphate aldolase class Ia